MTRNCENLLERKCEMFWVYIPQEHLTGKWWLIFFGNISLGYWPKELFNHLSSGASIVRYGGTSKDSRDGVSPPMGSGSYPNFKFKKAAFFEQNQIVGPDFVMTNINPSEMGKNVDTVGRCYDLKYFGYTGKRYGQVFSYGGPGGAFCGT